MSRDVLLLQKAKELGLLKPDAGLDRVAALRRESVETASKIEAGEASKVEHARWNAARPAYEYDEALHRAGLTVGLDLNRVPFPELARSGSSGSGADVFAPATQALVDALRENTAAQKTPAAHGTELPVTSQTFQSITNVGTMWLMPDERNSSFDIPFGRGLIDERGDN